MSGRHPGGQEEAVMSRWVSATMIRVLLVLLGVSVIAQLRLLPDAVASVVTTFPETEPLTVPAITWGVLAIACGQSVAIVGCRLAFLASDRAPKALRRTWLQAMVGCLLAFLVLVVTAYIALTIMTYTTPGVMYGLIFLGILAAIATAALAAHLRTTKPVQHYSQPRREPPALTPDGGITTNPQYNFSSGRREDE